MSMSEEIARSLFRENYLEVKAMGEILEDKEIAGFVKLWLNLSTKQKIIAKKIQASDWDEKMLKKMLELSEEDKKLLRDILSNPGDYGYLNQG